MVSCWASWKPFPVSENGGHIDAPIGPGVYEVRHTGTGELIAFGESAKVALDLSTLLQPPGSWSRLFGRKGLEHSPIDLEYRTCTAASPAEARIAAEQMRTRREAFWRSRGGWL
jgi:hypothetical protein